MIRSGANSSTRSSGASRASNATPVVERVDMMEHARGDDRVPRLRCQDIRNLLKLASQIAVAVRRPRVDAHDVIATLGEVLNETSLVAAAHLEHACRRGR